jgi:uncharacterized LabA/DUF88 family protein
MRTFIYIDGFNFYYTAVKNTPYKWLDFKLLFENILNSKNEISKIKYFTAKVTALNDPRRPLRQQTYIRALKYYIPEFQEFYGHFMTHVTSMPMANPTYPGQRVKVIKTEEKGSDVNLAVYLLNDAWLDLFDCAIIVSNDSDLDEAVRIVREDKKSVLVLLNIEIRLIAITILRRN